MYILKSFILFLRVYHNTKMIHIIYKSYEYRVSHTIRVLHMLYFYDITITHHENIVYLNYIYTFLLLIYYINIYIYIYIMTYRYNMYAYDMI